MQEAAEARWLRINSLLDQLLDRPADKRMTFLAAACPGDVRLRREVEGLLRAHDEAPVFLDGHAVELAGSLLSEDAAGDSPEAPDFSGRRIGPYRLIEEIGRGGMGVVYRAERADGSFDQQVAIKLVSLWRGKKMLRDRFHQEQQVLASLHHPNIAQLYDGGVTDDGQPYIVMEYVHGESLIHYCDKHGLGIDDRLKFVLQIIESLSYAHQNLVVHRDIKPSNILITEERQIKLLDFGIAKLLGEEAAASNLTQTGEQLLTPGFAAPEQIRGQAVTAATDTYQLGVILYELLTGQCPFPTEASFYELARLVCEVMPTRPSAALSRREEAAAPKSELFGRKHARHVTQWRKKLTGDLDAIVLKALRKEPEGRYGSMEAFGADLRAYRDGRPVVARKQSLRYQATKFVQRHRWGAAAAGLIAMLVIGYAVTVTQQAIRVREALGQAQIEADKAQEVAEFLTGIFKVSDPNVSGTESVTARELLDRGKERLDGELERAPEIRAQMLHVLGEIYYSLGSYGDSVSLLEDAVAIRRSLLAEHDPAVVRSIKQLATAYRSAGELGEARSLLEELLAGRRQSIDSAEEAEILNALAIVLNRQGLYGPAEAMFKDAIAMLRGLDNTDDRELGLALHNLANLQRGQGELEIAEANMREALETERRVFGEDHSYFTVSLNHLAGILTDMERYEEAEPLHQRALAVQESTLGPDHPKVANTLLSLGILAHRRGELTAATSYLRRALSIHLAARGEQNSAVAFTLYRLGVVRQELGDYAEAELLYEKVLSIDLAILDPGSSIIGRDLSQHASLLRAQGEFDLARMRYEEAFALLPASTLMTSTAQLGYALVLADLGELGRAEEIAREALNIRKQKLPSGHSQIAEAHATLGRVLWQAGRDEQALGLLEPAYKVLQDRRYPGDESLRLTREALEQIGDTRRHALPGVE